jgi:hypothetical protein
MADITLEKLRPLIANDQCFRRRDIAGAVMRLWYTRDKSQANVIAEDLLQLALNDGSIAMNVPIWNSSAGRSYSYHFIDKSQSVELVKMLDLLVATQAKLAEAERKLGLITCC